jgi:hypothetical protein
MIDVEKENRRIEPEEVQKFRGPNIAPQAKSDW